MPVTDSPAMENFRVNVRTVMEKGGISVSQLARDTNMERAGLSKLLNGYEACTIPRAEKIAIALGVPLQKLFAEPA